MEIVGVVAAVPALLTMIKTAGTIIGQVGSKSRIAKTANGIRTQLDLLAEVLASIASRFATETPRSVGATSQEKRLGPILRDVETEIKELLALVERIEQSQEKSSSNLFKRARLALSGFEKNLKDHGSRLNHMVNILQIYLTEWTIRSGQRAQLRKLLATASTDFIPKKLEGTLEWIWAHGAFAKWASPSSPQRSLEEKVLLIHGVKGCGKSVLAASVVEGLRSKGFTTLFFSFWASHSRERRIDAMLRALLWQLFEVLPEEAQQKFTPPLLESKTQLKDVVFLVDQLCNMAREHAKGVFCILDGIDESTDDWNSAGDESPISHLDKLLSSVPQLHLLLVGRHSSLRSAIKKWPASFEVTRDLVHDDLRLFISSELDKCPNITDEPKRNMVQRELDAKSTVMFLWIKLVFHELRSSFSPSEISHTLGRIPEELDREYSRLLTMLMTRLHGRSSNPSVGMVRAKALLEIIVGASRPLSLMELRLIHAFGFLGDEPQMKLSDVLISDEGIIDACGDLITVSNGLVHLGHTSIREFLLRPARSWRAQDGNVSYFRVDLARAHKALAVACFKYLQQVDWGACSQEDSNDRFGKVIAQYPLLHYASSFAIFHCLESDFSHHEATALSGELVASGCFTDWMDFVASFLDTGILYLHFWEDLVHFWGTCPPPGTIGLGGLKSFLFSSTRGLYDAQSEGNDPGGCIETAVSDASIATSNGDSTRHKSVVSHPQKTNHALGPLRQITPGTPNRHLARHLILRIPTVQTIINSANALIDPLDVLVRSLEKATANASYLHLMLVAFLICRIASPSASLKTFKKASLRVEGQGGLREAISLCLVAMCSDDLETELASMNKARTILESQPPDPLVNTLWGLTAVACVELLFRLRRFEEGHEVAAELEMSMSDRAAAISSSRKGKSLRDWCLRQLSARLSLNRWRMFTVMMLGSTHGEYGFDQVADKLLGPLAPEILTNPDLPTEDMIYWIALATRSKVFLGQIEDASCLLAKAKTFVRENSLEQCEELQALAMAQYEMALAMQKRGQAQEAADELASMDISAFLHTVICGEDYSQSDGRDFRNFVLCFLDVHDALGQRDEAKRQVLEIHWPIIDSEFEKGRMPCNSLLIPALKAFVSFGCYSVTEKYIRRMLAPKRLDSESTGLERLLLLEGLAFSIRHQDNRVVEASDLYAECALLASQEMPDWRSCRLDIGLGMAWILAGDAYKAVMAFSSSKMTLSKSEKKDTTTFAMHFVSMVSALATWQEGDIPVALSELQELLRLMEGGLEDDKFPCVCTTDVLLSDYEAEDGDGTTYDSGEDRDGENDGDSLRSHAESISGGVSGAEVLTETGTTSKGGSVADEDEERYVCIANSRCYILKVTACMLLAHLMDTTGQSPHAVVARKEALEALQTGFSWVFGPSCFYGRTFEHLVRTWAQACREHLQRTGQAEATDHEASFPWFPLDLLAETQRLVDEPIDVLFWPRNDW